MSFDLRNNMYLVPIAAGSAFASAKFLSNPAPNMYGCAMGAAVGGGAAFVINRFTSLGPYPAIAVAVGIGAFTPVIQGYMAIAGLLSFMK